jgi:antitoxin (DNA-binding transcriptional repressor) of toxin-antitoxin stability system
MSPVNGDGALGYTMRDLNQRTGQVMDEIQKYQRPAYITRHGRFIATITPLAPGQVESRVLPEMARQITKQPPAGPEPPVVRVGDDDALVYSVRELGLKTARLIKEIERAGKPAIITRHGRFTATIRPLAPGPVESAVLAAMAREIGQQEER